MNRDERAKLAAETLQILEAGGYTTSQGTLVRLAEQIAACKAASQLYLPEELEALVETVVSSPPLYPHTEIELRNETTLEEAQRLAASGEFERLGVLNFASAKNPGGGFLGGSQAQEESLARSSALYASLTACPEYYQFHRSHRDVLYSDRLIYSPGCPVFRDDSGRLLEVPYRVDFLTSPAPNAGALGPEQSASRSQIPAVLERRSAKILALAATRGCEALVLGAWGCGVFRNDPRVVAEALGKHLAAGQPFHGRFRRVLFAVLDRSQDQRTYTAFAQVFQKD